MQVLDNIVDYNSFGKNVSKKILAWLKKNLSRPGGNIGQKMIYFL